MTVPTLSDLLPCPFCGREPVIADNTGAKTCSNAHAFAHCGAPCYTEGPERETVAEAIAAWNTRALSTQKERIAELRNEVLEEAAAMADMLGGARERIPLREGDDKNARSDRVNRAQHVRAATIATAIRNLKSRAPRCGDEGQPLCPACSVPAHELTQVPGCGAPLPRTLVTKEQSRQPARVWNDERKMYEHQPKDQSHGE